MKKKLVMQNTNIGLINRLTRQLETSPIFSFFDSAELLEKAFNLTIDNLLLGI